MILVYSLVLGHPAAVPCEQFLRSQAGWFSSPLVLIEAKHILTRVYGVGAGDATAKLLQFTAGPVALLDLDAAAVASAFALADAHGLDLTDAVLLHRARTRGSGRIATDDARLVQACLQLGVMASSPLDAALRQQVAACEGAHLAPKGLPRILRRVYEWLSHNHPQAAHDFWSRTGGVRLP